VIQLRQDEIILNVINQIKESGFKDQLEAGIIMIGGASQMTGLADYFAEKAQMSVKRATPKRIYINNAAELLQNPVYTQALSLLLFANENCEKIEILQPEPQPIAPLQPEPVASENENKEGEKKKKKKNKKDKNEGQTSLIFKFFEKVQNFGGTVFDEDEEE
jgi:cell division protein FtsA